MPKVYDALKVQNTDITLEVQQQLGDGERFAARVAEAPEAITSESGRAAFAELAGKTVFSAKKAVVEMLQFIRDNDLTTKQFVEKVKNREDGVKLMGFGHRIYRNYDPRAAIIKKHADEILKLQTGRKDLLGIAKELEETALNDDYFKERKLYPNVDFYTGLIYEAMGFPMNMFTVLFALGRLPGWIAQYREQVASGGNKIWRPRQIFTGSDKRDYVPLDKRA